MMNKNNNKVYSNFKFFSIILSSIIVTFTFFNISFFSTNSGFNTIFPIYAIENNDEESTESINEDNTDSVDQLNDFEQEESTTTDISDGNDTMADLTGDAEQEESNQGSNLSTFSTENNQKLTQIANQIFNSTYSESQDLQDTQQIMGQLVQQISSISNKNIGELLNSVSNQLKNDQSGELRNALSIVVNEYYGENVNLINQIIQQISSQTTIEKDISAILIQVSNQIVNNFFKNKIIKNIDNDIKIVKLIQKDICQTQSDSIQLKGKILAKEVIVIADYTPCKIADGSVTFNIPDNPRLKFVILSLNINKDHESAMIDKTQIELIGGNNELYRINLDSEMNGRDPITKDDVVLTKINGLALYNSGSESIKFNPGDSLALSTVLSN